MSQTRAIDLKDYIVNLVLNILYQAKTCMPLFAVVVFNKSGILNFK